MPSNTLASKKPEPVPALGYWSRLWRKLTRWGKPAIDLPPEGPPLVLPPEVLADPTACYCPLCETRVARFEDYGNPPRPEAKCPNCGAVERHRLAWTYFKMSTNLFDGRPKSLLHVAPEVAIAARLARIPGVDYLSADLASPRAMVKMDLTNIQYPEGSFDVILCSHVLEHIPDDQKAMTEMFRVLRPGGWAAIQVPIGRAHTVEDPAAKTPVLRKQIYGQRDHVRLYGRDIVERLRAAGFEVEHTRPLAGIDPVLKARMRLKDQDIFFCRKPGG